MKSSFRIDTPEAFEIFLNILRLKFCLELEVKTRVEKLYDEFEEFKFYSLETSFLFLITFKGFF